LSKKTSVAAVAAELSRLLISTSLQDLGRDVPGLNLTGTCTHASQYQNQPTFCFLVC
jgi:hypothetical protein